MNTYLFIDGENIKGKIKSVFKESGKDDPVWHKYDFKGLLDKVLKDIRIETKAFYFARIKEHPKSKVKSRELIEEQRLLKTHLEKQGFQVILSGRVRGQMEGAQNGKSVLVFREKGVDVKIAVDMVSFSCDKKVKDIILCSSDSDLQPAIKEARDRKVSCTYLGFEVNPNKGISYTTNKTILIRNSEVLEYEFIMKTLKFTPELVLKILFGEKTSTWRLFDDKDLKVGDKLVLINKETGEEFGKAVITSLRIRTLGTLTDKDWVGHEKFASEAEMYATYRKYYGDKVNKDSEVKILTLELKK